jgi:tetratricopeptide (TPR) repeat protein
MAAAVPVSTHVIVTVVNKHVEPAQPVPGARVTIDFVDGSQKITEARDRTNSQGQTELVISPEAQQRGDLHIEISDAPNLVVYQPSEGILTDVHPTLTIVLLPRGSPALLQPAQIEAMLNRLSRMSIQNQQLQVSLNKVEHQKPDFDGLLRNWASTNGLPYDQVDQQMRAWANDVLDHRQEASLTKQGEAELALRHFENAAKLFQGAVNTSKLALHREQESYLVARRAALRSLFEESTQGADAFQLADQYHQATQIMDDAVKEAAAEHQRYPGDIALRHIWFRAVRYTSYVRVQEGAWAVRHESLNENPTALFSKAVDDCKVLLAQIDRSAEQEQYSTLQSVIASAYLALGTDVPHNKDSAEFRSQAVVSARNALDSANKEKDPVAWVRDATIYSLILAMTSLRSYNDDNLPADQASQSLSQAIDVLHSILEVTRSKNPLEWGKTQTVISNVFTLQAMLTSDKRATDLLIQAEASARAALEVLNKTDHPGEWAMAEGSLGSSLYARSMDASGNQQHDFILHGATAMQESLQVDASQEDPLDWAEEEQNLATMLGTGSDSFTGNQAIDLLIPSVAAWRFELKIVTKESAPLRWAETQFNLGSALGKLADLYNNQGQAKDVADYRSQAAAAFRAALEVFNRQKNADRWAHAQWALGAILFAQSQVDPASPSTDLLAQAANAHSVALEVITEQTSPQVWGSMQKTLGQIRAVQGLHSSGQQAKDFFAQSAEALTATLQIAPKDADTLSLLNSLYHDYLMDFPKAYDYASRAEAVAPNESNKLNLAEAALTTSRFSTCIDLINSVHQAQLEDRLIPGRLTLLLACQWGAGEHAAASQTAEAVALSASTLTKIGWIAIGDCAYLSSAPEFSADRPIWIKLFRSLEQGDGPALGDAAHTIHQGAGN